MRIAIPLVIIISLLNLFNATPSREFVVAGSKYEDAEYMNLFKLPNTLFTYSANGGERQNNKLTHIKVLLLQVGILLLY